MAKHRVMIYHQAGSPTLTVEVVIRADVDGETLEKSDNASLGSKAIMECLSTLETLVDAELGLAGDDPLVAEKFATIAEPATETLDQTP